MSTTTLSHIEKTSKERKGSSFRLGARISSKLHRNAGSHRRSYGMDFLPSFKTSSTQAITDISVRSTLNTSTSKRIDDIRTHSLIRNIRKFLEFNDNWDGYNGIKPSLNCIEEAIQLLKMLPTDRLPQRAGLSNDGEISLIWESESLFADFGTEGDNTYSFFIKKDGEKLYGDDIPLSESIPEAALKLLK